MTSNILSCFLDSKRFVEKSYLTKSTFDLGTALCNILSEKTLLIASVKSFILLSSFIQFFSGSTIFFGDSTNGQNRLN